VLLTASPTFFSQPEIAAATELIPITPNLRAWSDDYSSLLPILELSHH